MNYYVPHPHTSNVQKALHFKDDAQLHSKQIYRTPPSARAQGVHPSHDQYNQQYVSNEGEEEGMGEYYDKDYYDL